MANFDYRALMTRISKLLGYHLFMDYGAVEDDYAPYRAVNEIVTPICGVFRLNPTPLTALKYPYIAVTNATIDIPSPTEEVESVRDKLNEVAASLNATAEKIVIGDTSYTVVYGFETCVVGDKRRDVSLYNGEIIPVTQVVTFTIVESGVSCFDVGLKIDGIDVPILLMMETRTAASETAPNANAKGEVTISQELYGITFETPAVENTLGDLLREIVDDGNGNRAHAVEVTKSGESKAYMMAVGSSGSTVRPPNNVGYSLSLAEVSPNVARFNDLWEVNSVSGTVVSYTAPNAVVFWGDGTSSKVRGTVVHTYMDGKTDHTAYAMRYGDEGRWKKIKKGVNLYGKRIKAAEGEMIAPSTLPATVLTTDKGDSLKVVGGRLTMVVDGKSYNMDTPDTILGFALHGAFTSLLRGSVDKLYATDALVYDRYAVNEEV